MKTKKNKSNVLYENKLEIKPKLEYKSLKDQLADLSEKTKNRLEKSVINSLLIYFSNDEEIKKHIEYVLNSQFNLDQGIPYFLTNESDIRCFYQYYKEEIFKLAHSRSQYLGYDNAIVIFSKLNLDNKISSIKQEEAARVWFGYKETLSLVSQSLKLKK